MILTGDRKFAILSLVMRGMEGSRGSRTFLFKGGMRAFLFVGSGSHGMHVYSLA